MKPSLFDVVAPEHRDHCLLLEMATDAGPKALQLRAQDAAAAQLLVRKLDFLREHHAPAIANITDQPLLQPSPAAYPRPLPASPPPIRTAPPSPAALRGSQFSPTACLLASPMGPSPPRGVNPTTLEAELDSPLAARAPELIAQAARQLRAPTHAQTASIAADTSVRQGYGRAHRVLTTVHDAQALQQQVTFLEDTAQRLSRELAARQGRAIPGNDNDSWLDAALLPPLLYAYDAQLQHLQSELQHRTAALESLSARLDTLQAATPAHGAALPLTEQRVMLLQEENRLLRQQAEELESTLAQLRQAADGRAAEQLQLTVELGSAAAQVGSVAAEAAEAKRQYAHTKVL